MIYFFLKTTKHLKHLLDLFLLLLKVILIILLKIKLKIIWFNFFFVLFHKFFNIYKFIFCQFDQIVMIFGQTINNRFEAWSVIWLKVPAIVDQLFSICRERRRNFCLFILSRCRKVWFLVVHHLIICKTEQHQMSKHQLFRCILLPHL